MFSPQVMSCLFDQLTVFFLEKTDAVESYQLWAPSTTRSTSHCKRHIQHPPGSSCRAFQKALWFMVCLPGSPSDQHRQLHGEARGNFPSTLLVEPTNHSVLQLSLSHLHKFHQPRKLPVGSSWDLPLPPVGSSGQKKYVGGLRWATVV